MNSAAMLVFKSCLGKLVWVDMCVSERAMSGTLWLFCVWFYFGLHGSTNRNIFLKLTLCGGSKKAFWTLHLCVSCVPVFIGGFVFGQLCFFFSATASSFIHEVYLFFLWNIWIIWKNPYCKSKYMYMDLVNGDVMFDCLWLLRNLTREVQEVVWTEKTVDSSHR